MKLLWVCLVVCGLGSATATRSAEEVADVRPTDNSAPDSRASVDIDT